MHATLLLRPPPRTTRELPPQNVGDAAKSAPGATDRYGQPLGGHRFAFTTGALPATVSLALPGYSASATYSASAEPILYFQATNLSSASFTLYPLTSDEGRLILHDPAQASGDRFTPSLPALRSWSEDITGSKDTVVLGRTSLSGGGPLPKGYYFVRTGGAMRSQFAFAVVDTVILAKLSQNELLVVVTPHIVRSAERDAASEIWLSPAR